MYNQISKSIYRSLVKFHETAAEITGFRGNIGNLFTAIALQMIETKTDACASEYTHWNAKTRIGKKEFYDALEWLHDAGFISYEKGKPRLPGRVTIITEEHDSVRSHTKTILSPYQDHTETIPSPYLDHTQTIPNGLAYTHEHGRAEKEYTSGVVEYNTSSREKEVVSSSCSSSNATGENFNSGGGGDNNDVPDFVRRDREAAEALREQLAKGKSHYADRHPPVTTGTAAIAEEWCTIGGNPFTRQATENYIRQLFAGTKGEPMQKRTRLSVEDVLPAFMEKRALNGEFANKRHLFACVEGFAEDVRDGKETADSAKIKLKKSASPMDNLVWN